MTRGHKIVAPAQQEKPRRYKREEIDYAALDDIGMISIVVLKIVELICNFVANLLVPWPFIHWFHVITIYMKQPKNLSEKFISDKVYASEDILLLRLCKMIVMK